MLGTVFQLAKVSADTSGAINGKVTISVRPRGTTASVNKLWNKVAIFLNFLSILSLVSLCITTIYLFES